MSDFLLRLGKNEGARRVIKGLGLPLPMPVELRRAVGPDVEKPLSGKTVVLGGEGDCVQDLLGFSRSAGAPAFVVGEGAAKKAENGHAVRRLELSAMPEALSVDALVFDASAYVDPGQLIELHRFFHPLIRRLSKGGRVLVVGRNSESVEDAGARATQRALLGFVKSLSKELGKRGVAVNALELAPGAEGAGEGPFRYLLSERSAFVTGQRIVVSRQGPSPELRWVRPFEGQDALVTGAARGIGRETARRLAEEGARVICLDRPEDEAMVTELAEEIGGTVLLADLGKKSAPEEISSHITNSTRGLDVLVHNAGITRDRTLAKISSERFQEVVEINLSAIHSMTRRLIDEDLMRSGGRIVCVSSVAGIAGNMGQTNYAASKAGVIGLVEGLANELSDVTVNAVAPGFIETRLTAAIPVMIREAGRRLSNLGQGGLPQDVADAIVFLSSPGAYGVNGAVLRVCGGAFIGA